MKNFYSPEGYFSCDSEVKVFSRLVSSSDMAKSTYFTIAITVAGLALIAYFLLDDNLILNLTGQDEKPVKSREEKIVQSKSASSQDESQQEKSQSTSTVDENTQSNEPIEDGTSQGEAHSAETTPKKPAPGKIIKLGEHGAPVLDDFVEELDYVLNGKDFYRHFIRKRTPVVLRGGAKTWPAYLHWSNETYLKMKYGDEQLDVEFTKKYEKMPPVKKTISLTEFLEIYKREEVYLDSPIPQSAMTQDIVVPPCLQCKELLSGIGSVHLLYSSGGTSSSLHQDGYENLLTVFSGRKEVLLAHYNNSKYLVRNLSEQNDRSYTGLAALDPEAVDLLAFPQLANMTFYKVGYSTYNTETGGGLDIATRLLPSHQGYQGYQCSIM